MTSLYEQKAYKRIAAFFNEPDYYHSCAFGLPYYLRRNPMKAWCGYVGVPSTHPHYGLSYTDRVMYEAKDQITVGQKSPVNILVAAFTADSKTVSLDVLYDCPGGLTWADNRAALERPDGYWYFGFDCSHYNDYSPKDAMSDLIDPAYWKDDRVYRTFAYANAGAVHLANQLSDFSSAYPEILNKE